MAISDGEAASLQAQVWAGSLPLEVRLAPVDCRTYATSMPYITHVPRLSYLPFLLQRLHDFFRASLVDADVAPHQGWFSCQGVPMKWQHPIGLLYDLFSGADAFEHDAGSGPTGSSLPWKLVLHFSEWPMDQLIPLDASGKVQNDNFINSCKEADYLRASGKAMMGLSKEDSTRLWQAVVRQDLDAFNSVNNKLLNPASGQSFRNIPIKVYLPHSDDQGDPGASSVGMVRVLQSPVPPVSSPRNPQTMVTALHELLPTVFPSKRSFYHGKAVLHGAVVPPGADLLELVKTAAYADGFLHVAVALAT